MIVKEIQTYFLWCNYIKRFSFVCLGCTSIKVLKTFSIKSLEMLSNWIEKPIIYGSSSVSYKWWVGRVPEKIWKTTDVLAKLLTSLYKICDQSVGKRISHLYISQWEKLSIIRLNINSDFPSWSFTQISLPLTQSRYVLFEVQTVCCVASQFTR